MRFKDFRRFSGRGLGDVLSWLTNELSSVMRELYIGLGFLTFEDNFKDLRGETPLENDVVQFNGTRWIFQPILTIINIFFPPGTVLSYLGATEPAGFKFLNGQAVSRTTYATLFTEFGTTYGVGDGSTTFNLPDDRGRFELHQSAAGTGSTMGGTFGALDLTVSIPAHYHGMGTGADLNITASGSHAHGPGNGQFFQTSNNTITTPGAGAVQFSNTAIIATTAAATHSHASGDIAGRVGLVTGGVDGNAAMTSGAANPAAIVRKRMVWTGVL